MFDTSQSAFYFSLTKYSKFSSSLVDVFNFSFSSPQFVFTLSPAFKWKFFQRTRSLFGSPFVGRQWKWENCEFQLTKLVPFHFTFSFHSHFFFSSTNHTQTFKVCRLKMKEIPFCFFVLFLCHNWVEAINSDQMSLGRPQANIVSFQYWFLNIVTFRLPTKLIFFAVVSNRSIYFSPVSLVLTFIWSCILKRSPLLPFF